MRLQKKPTWTHTYINSPFSPPCHCSPAHFHLPQNLVPSVLFLPTGYVHGLFYVCCLLFHLHGVIMLSYF